MNLKKNPYLVTGLCSTLFICVVIIAVLLWSKNSASVSPEPKLSQIPKLQSQPNQNQQPPRPIPPHPQSQETPVAGSRPAIVLFYMEKCIHSRNMMPSWQQMKQTLEQTNQFDVLSLEAEQYPQEMQRHGINGYPMIRFYPEGFPGSKFIDYRGTRTTESLIKFVRSGGQES